jgi:hypothetical protein
MAPILNANRIGISRRVDEGAECILSPVLSVDLHLVWGANCSMPKHDICNQRAAVRLQ